MQIPSPLFPPGSREAEAIAMKLVVAGEPIRHIYGVSFIVTHQGEVIKQETTPSGTK
jgi:hypothetical protein